MNADLKGGILTAENLIPACNRGGYFPWAKNGEDLRQSFYGGYFF